MKMITVSVTLLNQVLQLHDIKISTDKTQAKGVHLGT